MRIAIYALLGSVGLMSLASLPGRAQGAPEVAAEPVVAAPAEATPQPESVPAAAPAVPAPAASAPVDAAGVDLVSAPPQAPPPAPPPPAPVVDVVARAAAQYASFQADVSNYAYRTFASNEELELAVDVFGGQNPGQLAAGWLSYGAMIAARHPEFRASVLDIASFHGREVMIRGLELDSGWAMREVRGAREALDFALVALSADARRLEQAGEQMRLQGYQLQSSQWALRSTENADGRTATLRALALAGRPVQGAAMRLMEGPQLEGALADAGRAGARSLWDGAGGALDIARTFVSLSTPTFFSTTPSPHPNRSRTAENIISLAALHVLAEGQDTTGVMLRVSRDIDAVTCHEQAQRQFLSCVRSNKFRYERPVCMSEHVIKDTAECIREILQ